MRGSPGNGECCTGAVSWTMELDPTLNTEESGQLLAPWKIMGPVISLLLMLSAMRCPLQQRSTHLLAQRFCLRAQVRGLPRHPATSRFGFYVGRNSTFNAFEENVCPTYVETTSSNLDAVHAGIILNNQMDDFSTPDQPNTYGLPPSKPNFIRPFKKPQSSMAPMIVVTSDGRLRAVLGASGGPRIISALIQTLFRYHISAISSPAVTVPVKAARHTHKVCCEKTGINIQRTHCVVITALSCKWCDPERIVPYDFGVRNLKIDLPAGW